MNLEEPPASVDLVPDTGCPHCSEKWEEEFPGPLSREAAPAKDPDGFDWNAYYWGYDWPPHEQPAERKTIRRPLPHSITRRIPLELYEHIIHFLPGYQGSLYSCALVHHAWYHISQKLLYCSVEISQQAHFVAVIRNQCSYSSATRALRMYLEEDPTMSSKHAIKTLPIVASKELVHQLQCLSIYSFKVPYNRNIAMFMSRFSRLSHLNLSSFRLYSFGDLRRIICALPGLLDLTLSNGDAASGSLSHQDGAGFTPRSSPRLRKMSLVSMKSGIMAPFSQWLASTDVCSTCTELIILIGSDPSEDCATYIRPILEHIGCTLQSLKYIDYGDFSHIDHLMAPLAHCTRLSTLVLEVRFPNSNSWQDLVTTLHNMVLHISSPRIQKLQLKFGFVDRGYRHELLPKDSVLGNIALGPIHNTIKSSQFDSLRDVTFSIIDLGVTSRDDLRISRDVALSDDELENQLRLLLQPWDKRGILTFTDDEGRPLRADPRASETRFHTSSMWGVPDAEEDKARKGLGERGDENEG